MANSATQNPANKVGRNSGGGPVGTSALIPSAREAERGLEPIRLDDGRGGTAWGAIGMLAALAAGAGAGYLYMLQQRKQRRGLRGAVNRMNPWK